ncbi:hypothetical protein [Nocardioides marmoribigeumensis]|uniref:Histone H3/H4 n=1 Tax=Nocardioides marmoribigeumensis TaxID=433649 RepID=A0ABU2BY81_9ACTN|nr:hypothetical protein [Nocardioides marmoribigeumensis]MDR7363356.1 histone H3/H4 [Nocardioides marmoribigeumensis]
MLDQHIAVFGESGSGKTVMLSSFYGSAQEPRNIKKSAFHLVAESGGQGTHLHQNYLGMKNSATVPAANKFKATTYCFLLKFKGEQATGPLAGRSYDAMRLAWHDYPGEWFEHDVSGPEEEQRRVATFRDLLSSHVALILVDGQKLLDNVGEEERYLKSLLGNFRNSLIRLKDDLLVDGEPLAVFPRIWVVALSKSDLLPDLDVHAFKELVIEKVGDELVDLRSVLGGLVESDGALSVGEDFVIMSSAKFSPGAIEVDRRVGVDLVLPMAAILPFERHVRWVQAGRVSRKVAIELVSGAEIVAAALGSITGLAAILAGRRGKVATVVSLALTRLLPRVEKALKSAGSRLEDLDTAAASTQENLSGTLAGFRADLQTAEEEAVLVKSVG